MIDIGVISRLYNLYKEIVKKRVIGKLKNLVISLTWFRVRFIFKYIVPRPCSFLTL